MEQAPANQTLPGSQNQPTSSQQGPVATTSVQNDCLDGPLVFSNYLARRPEGQDKARIAQMSAGQLLDLWRDFLSRASEVLLGLHEAQDAGDEATVTLAKQQLRELHKETGYVFKNAGILNPGVFMKVRCTWNHTLAVGAEDWLILTD